MGWVEPIVFSDLCEWLDLMAMHQSDVIMQTGGTIGDSLCALCPWFFGIDTWVSFPLSWRQGWQLQLPRMAIQHTPEQLRLRHSTNSIDCNPRLSLCLLSKQVCSLPIFRIMPVSDISPAPPVYTKYQSSIRKGKHLFRTDLAPTAAN
jgi:hypothetical protein